MQLFADPISKLAWKFSRYQLFTCLDMEKNKNKSGPRLAKPTHTCISLPTGFGWSTSYYSKVYGYVDVCLALYLFKTHSLCDGSSGAWQWEQAVLMRAFIHWDWKGFRVCMESLGLGYLHHVCIPPMWIFLWLRRQNPCTWNTHKIHH